MESSFAIIAEPNRRAILSMLISSQRSVGEIERQPRARRRIRCQSPRELHVRLRHPIGVARIGHALAEEVDRAEHPPADVPVARAVRKAALKGDVT